MTQASIFAENEANSGASLTPMMRQYHKIKAQHPDCILFFRLGDFYEMFGDDAKQGAEVLEITLTQRHGTPMCGVPHHAAEQYVARLTARGHKVALCEQVSDPNLPGIVERAVVRVVTPGTTLSETLVDRKSNHYTVAIVPKRDLFGVASVDLTTGTFWVTELRGYDQLANELQRLDPKECLVPDGQSSADLQCLLSAFPNLFVSRYSTRNEAHKILKEQLKVDHLESFGLEKWPLGVEAAGLVVNYLQETQKTALSHLKPLRAYAPESFMLLDEATLRNLELIGTLRDGQKQGSLLGVMDQTQTAMGGRLLRQWLVRPLTERTKIESRLQKVEVFFREDEGRGELRDALSHVLDLERVVGRLTLDRGSPRELVALRNSLATLPHLKQRLTGLGEELNVLAGRIIPLPDLVEHLTHAVVEEPPALIKDGGFIREGFNTELDELRLLTREGKGFIATLQQKEIARTGINSLKVKYNQVFGYYIEISKANLAHVPEDYIRKQTLVNAERYITPELKAYEEKVLTAEEKSKALEIQLFQELKERVLEVLGVIQSNAEVVAELDVLLSFAEVARRCNYTKPSLNDSNSIQIEQGRHPVVESMNPSGDFVPNDLHLNETGARVILLTGPNMSGKSTYLRQTALITLMAQIGSYVPARSASLGVVDRIFTRVGASDNLVRGQSTFMVEMQEAANILNHATDRSLVILDEIGRGTSTYDGVSIAWAILEHLHNTIGAKTLFASHYHELIAVADQLPHAENWSVAVEESVERGVIFLHQIQKDGIDKSYGIEVGKLAGLPNSVIDRAQNILSELEEGVVDQSIQRMERAHVPLKSRTEERLKQLDINHMTPLEALQALESLKREM